MTPVFFELLPSGFFIQSLQIDILLLLFFLAIFLHKIFLFACLYLLQSCLRKKLFLKALFSKIFAATAYESLNHETKQNIQLKGSISDQNYKVERPTMFKV